MKTKKFTSTIITAIILFTSTGVSVAVANTNPPPQQQQQQQPQMPVLRIAGEVNPNVYLQSLDIQVEVTGNIASTRYTMVFKNKTNRILEGMLTFPLPDGRTVTHYALDINGRMRDAVPVEKARATQVFEEIQQREVDPGLLERVEGNNYRTRIYPIPANGQRTVSIGYEEELALENGQLYYRLPMAYADPIEKFSIKATVWKSGLKPTVPQSELEIRFDRAGENYVASFARNNYRPARALIFALPAPTDIPQVMMQSAQGSFYFLASIAPNVNTRKKQWSDELAIIWDVSLSGSQRNLQREMEALDVIFADKKNVLVNLYYLNNRLTKTGQYRVNNGNWSALKRVLESAVFDGGTDYSRIDLNGIIGNEILFFSDGLSTLSDADFIVDTSRPIHAIISSSKADYSAMRLISGKTGGKFVNINALSTEQLRAELLNETLQFLGVVHGNSISEVHPSIAAPVQGNFSIAGISGSNSAELTLLFGFGSSVERRVNVKLNAQNASRLGNIHRIWAQKKIAELDLNFERNRAELTELGQQFGIVTRNTSLIVLEEINDYVNFNIEPPATEPQLLAEYQRRMKGREQQRQQLARGLLEQAVAAANNVASWWDRNFVPPKSKYPVPDDDRSSSRRGGALSADDGPRDFFESLPQERRERLGSASAASIDDELFKRRQSAERELGSQMQRPVADGNTFGRGGFATDIDAILSGSGGLRSGGDGGTGRRGVAGIGYGAGHGSGFGSGGGTDDLLGGLTGGDGGPNLKKRGELRTSSPEFLKGGSLQGGRSRASIQRVVMQNMASLRHAYNRRLREIPGLMGKITVKFAINEFGDVMFADMRESTMNDPEFERFVLERVRSWNFGANNKPGDVTEVVYPFVFSNGYDGGDEPESVTRERIRVADSIVRVRDSINREARRVADSIWRAEAPKRDSLARIQDSIWRERRRVTDSLERIARRITDKVYMNELTGNLADDYQKYLRSRDEFANIPAFYFDMADHFFKKNDRETALRILTSIADLELENASLYRLLGYRFKEYGEYALQKFVCKKVVEWRPMEPQSYRDYALALADAGEEQAALDSLYSLLTKTYSANIGRRSAGIEEVVFVEMNRLIARNPRLNTSRIDNRLLINTPVDIRVVINWNMNNTDIDLHVTDPNGHECYYRNTQTRAGGRISHDNTSGYGPEQFLLKSAVRGRYRIHVNHYSAREFAADGPSTVMAEIYMRYADKSERRRVVCLQLPNARRGSGGGKVLVGEFDF